MIYDDAEGRWFREAPLPFAEATVRIDVAISQILHESTSPYGEIIVAETPFFGRVLILDEIIQMSDRDEFIYHEMMVTLPALRHGAPRRVLIIGGADGGAARRAAGLVGAERIVQVEIDATVIDVCREFFPEVSAGVFDDPRVELHVGDGYDYVMESGEHFDLVVLDITDPVPGGPAERLMSQEFLDRIAALLDVDGVLSMHCGSLLFQMDKARVLFRELKRTFPEVNLHTALIPTFELTEFGFLVAAKAPQALDPAEVTARMDRLVTYDCGFLTPEMYTRSMTLPPYLTRQLTSDLHDG